MQEITATYSADDNKLRLSALHRLDAETYARVKAAGFAWAPKQDQFIAPMWTPARADLCIELAGSIEDDEGTLDERAEQRAERFEDYQGKRAADADRAAAAVRRIADGIPFGQPILIGHHSQRHAERDAKRIEDGMRKAVRAFDTAEYWKRRAAASIRHADYKQQPDVRHRRIKALEADQRKHQKDAEECETIARIWSKVPRAEWDKQTALALAIAGRIPGEWGIYSAIDAGTMHGDTAWRRAIAHAERRASWAARWLEHIANRLAYERAMLGESGGLAADRFDIQPGGRVLIDSEWLVVMRVNKSGGRVVSVTTSARFVRVRGIEEVQDYRAPDPEEAAKVEAVKKLAPLCNYKTDDCREMTAAEWKRAAAHSDSYFVSTVAGTDDAIAHRVRTCSNFTDYKRRQVFITDAKETRPAKPGDMPKGGRHPWTKPIENPAPVKFERQIEPAKLPDPVPTQSAPVPGDTRAEIDAMRESLRAGVQVVSAPQLFPTPADLAARMVEAAQITHGAYVLEPSAGTGRIVDAIAAAVPLSSIKLDCIEINHSMAQMLRAKYPDAYAVRPFDFLSFSPNPDQLADAVIMNPPFAKGADVEHVTHAAGFLAPGGRLVAVMSSGVTFRDDRKTRDFRALVDRMGGTIEPLPADTFASSGTGVNTVLVVLTAPDGDGEKVTPAEDVAPDAVAAPVAIEPARDWVQTCGRWFRVLATFEANDTAGANAYMEAHDGAALILISGGVAYLAHRDDQGTTRAPDDFDPQPVAIEPDPHQVAEIVSNEIRRRIEWADDGNPTAHAIRERATALEDCAREMDKAGDWAGLPAVYRAAAARLRTLAETAGPTLSDEIRAAVGVALQCDRETEAAEA